VNISYDAAYILPNPSFLQNNRGKRERERERETVRKGNAALIKRQGSVSRAKCMRSADRPYIFTRAGELRILIMKSQ